MKTLDLDFLRKIPLFVGLKREELEQVRSIMTIRTIAEGSFIIRENEQGHEMFVLLDGEVEVSRSLLLKIAGSVIQAIRAYVRRRVAMRRTR